MRTAVEFLAIGLISLVVAGLWTMRSRPGLDPVQVPWKALAGRQVLLVDARSSEDYARGHLAGAVSLPGQERPWVPPELRQGEVAVYGHPARFSAIVNTARALSAYRDKPVLLVLDAPLPP